MINFITVLPIKMSVSLMVHPTKKRGLLIIVLEWRIMKRWSKEENENDGQEAIDDEICKLARVAMRKSFLLPHPEHVTNGILDFER